MNWYSYVCVCVCVWERDEYEDVSKSFRTEFNEINNNNNKHSLRSNTKGYGGKSHQTDSQNSDTTAPSGRELYHLQFSLQAASSETFVYSLVIFSLILGRTWGNLKAAVSAEYGSEFSLKLWVIKTELRFLINRFWRDRLTGVVMDRKVWQRNASIPRMHKFLARFLLALFNEALWGCIQKFQDWPAGARTANVTALCH
jgi:hypothetical protein